MQEATIGASSEFPKMAAKPRRPRAAPIFPPLEEITRPTVTTLEAAYYLDRKPQTLRGWSCNEDGPLRPLRINTRLAWPVAELRRVLGVSQ